MAPEVEKSFITIIDSILAASDLNTISEKRIRKGLQAAVQYDITPQKVRTSAIILPSCFSLTSDQESIKMLIMARFDKFMAEKSAAPTTRNSEVVKEESSESPRPKDERHHPTPHQGRKRASDEDDLSDAPDISPPKKKRKAEPFIDADALYAAKLQAEENSRARPTRGAARKHTVIKKKRTPKKKTSEKVKAEDDSDLQNSGSETTEKKVNRSGGFHVSIVRP